METKLESAKLGEEEGKFYRAITESLWPQWKENSSEE